MAVFAVVEVVIGNSYGVSFMVDGPDLLLGRITLIGNLSRLLWILSMLVDFVLDLHCATFLGFWTMDLVCWSLLALNVHPEWCYLIWIVAVNNCRKLDPSLKLSA